MGVLLSVRLKYLITFFTGKKTVESLCCCWQKAVGQTEELLLEKAGPQLTAGRHWGALSPVLEPRPRAPPEVGQGTVQLMPVSQLGKPKIQGTEEFANSQQTTLEVEARAVPSNMAATMGPVSYADVWEPLIHIL